MRKTLLLAAVFAVGSIGFAAAHDGDRRHQDGRHYQHYRQAPPPGYYGPPPGYYDPRYDDPYYYGPPPGYYDDRPDVCVGGGNSRFCFRVR